MKNKKAFTLIEVVVVIFIISIIMILVIPKILNSVKNKQVEISEVSKQMIYDATDIYIKENETLYPTSNDSIYCIKIETLVKSGKLVEPLKDLKSNKNISLDNYVKATVNSYNQFDYEVVSSCNDVGGGD